MRISMRRLFRVLTPILIGWALLGYAPRAFCRELEGALDARPSTAPGRYALLVGNNSYPNFPARRQLRGCEDDARLMREVLATRYDVPRNRIRTVLGAEATRAGILEGLNWLLSQGQAGDVLLFFYSGHGTQVMDSNGDEADGLDEALAPYDVRLTAPKRAVNAILDDELAELTSRAANDRVFVAIFDCCHSGTGLRSVFSDRRAKYLYYEGPGGADSPADATRSVMGASEGFAFRSYFAPPSSDADQSGRGFDFREKESRGESVVRGVTSRGVKGAMSRGRILVAASRDNELASESDPVSIGGRTEVHGLLTLALYRLLSHEPPEKMTYGLLKSSVERPFVQGGNTQNPQVEADQHVLDAPFLGYVATDEPSATASSNIQVASEPSPTQATQVPATSFPSTPAAPEPTATSEMESAATVLPIVLPPEAGVAPPEPQAPMPEPTAVVRPSPGPPAIATPVCAPTPKPPPASVQTAEGPSLVSPETGAFRPAPLRVALVRADEMDSAENWRNSLDPAESERLEKKIESVLSPAPEMVSLVERPASWNLLVVYGSRRRGRTVSHNVAVVDSQAQIVAQYREISVDGAAAKVRRQVNRAWTVTNLLAIRQPYSSPVDLGLRIDEARARGMLYERHRYKLGESLVFGIRSNGDGYLTLINIACDGSINLLYPNKQMTSNQGGFVRDGEWFQVPGPGTGLDQPIDVIEPLGPECVKAFLTPRPLVVSPSGFKKRFSEPSSASDPGDAGIFRGSGDSSSRVRAAGVRPPGDIDWSALAGTDWGENTILFATGR